jgi:hypothetical protein
MGEHEPVPRVGQNLVGEQARELPVADGALLELVHLAVDKVQLGVEDDAEQPVAADHRAEQPRFMLPVDRLHPAVGPHDPQGADRGHETACTEVHPVCVRRDGAAHAEDVDARHG